MSKNYEPGDVIDVRIEKIVPRGLGLGFAEKLTVFVPLAAPGDLVRVSLTEIKRRTAFAEIVEIIEPGPNRIPPPCPYFGVCGGCDFQQMSYAAQLAAKQEIIRDCLHRIGKIEIAEIPIIGSLQEFSYRSRARWHLDGSTKTIGYFQRDSHNVVDIKVCPIATPELQSVLDGVRENTDWNVIWSDRAELEGAAGDGNEQSLFSRDMPEATSELSFTSGGYTYTYSAATFFQANKFLIPTLIDLAVGDISGQLAFDLYCGVGLFTLPLASRFGKVLAVEGNPLAAEFAKRNVTDAAFENVNVVVKGVGKFLSENRTGGVDLVLIDPPRAGTDQRTIDALIALKPAAISYVSCEPSILARDLRLLIDGGYSIEKITAVDLFPQTHHVETVVRLVRSS